MEGVVTSHWSRYHPPTAGQPPLNKVLTHHVLSASIGVWTSPDMYQTECDFLHWAKRDYRNGHFATHKLEEAMISFNNGLLTLRIARNIVSELQDTVPTSIGRFSTIAFNSAGSENICGIYEGTNKALGSIVRTTIQLTSSTEVVIGDYGDYGEAMGRTLHGPVCQEEMYTRSTFQYTRIPSHRRHSQSDCSRDTVDVVCQTSFDTQSDCSQWYSGCRVSDVVWHTEWL